MLARLLSWLWVKSTLRSALAFRHISEGHCDIAKADEGKQLGSGTMSLTERAPEMVFASPEASLA